MDFSQIDAFSFNKKLKLEFSANTKLRFHFWNMQGSGTVPLIYHFNGILIYFY